MTVIGRRRFLAALVAAGATSMPRARILEGRGFIGCRVDGEGRHLASVFDESGRIHHDVPLPGRGHGFSVQPSTGHVVVFARRPGEWALALDPATGAVSKLLAAADGRRFYGHGAFSPDGGLLYTSENRFEDGHGTIGVREAAGSWRRIREWSSHGVGPHEIRVFGGGGRLAVANGGIRTHPDTGRAKLNLDTMHSSLVVLDTFDGRAVGSASFGGRLRRLSIRHLDIDRDARIVVAMQHEGSRRERVPLVAFDGDAGLVPAFAPAAVRRRMRQYAGSVSFDATGRYVAVSHPHEGIVSLWAARSARWIAAAELEDTCGIAAGTEPGVFIATGAGGRIARIDARTGTSVLLARTGGSHWDNHLQAPGAPAQVAGRSPPGPRAAPVPTNRSTRLARRSPHPPTPSAPASSRSSPSCPM